MKAVFVIFAQPLESDVMGALKQLNIKQYTKFPYLLGLGGHSEPHLDTQTWPGANYGLFISTDEQTKDKLLKSLKEIKEKNIEEGLKVFVMPLEEII